MCPSTTDAAIQNAGVHCKDVSIHRSRVKSTCMIVYFTNKILNQIISMFVIQYLKIYLSKNISPSRFF